MVKSRTRTSKLLSRDSVENKEIATLLTKKRKKKKYAIAFWQVEDEG